MLAEKNKERINLCRDYKFDEKFIESFNLFLDFQEELSSLSNYITVYDLHIIYDFLRTKYMEKYNYFKDKLSKDLKKQYPQILNVEDIYLGNISNLSNIEENNCLTVKLKVKLISDETDICISFNLAKRECVSFTQSNHINWSTLTREDIIIAGLDTFSEIMEYYSRPNSLKDFPTISFVKNNVSVNICREFYNDVLNVDFKDSNIKNTLRISYNNNTNKENFIVKSNYIDFIDKVKGKEIDFISNLYLPINEICINFENYASLKGIFLILEKNQKKVNKNNEKLFSLKNKESFLKRFKKCL